MKPAILLRWAGKDGKRQLEQKFRQARRELAANPTKTSSVEAGTPRMLNGFVILRYSFEKSRSRSLHNAFSIGSAS